MVIYSHDWILVGLGVFAVLCFLVTLFGNSRDEASLED